MAKIIPAPMASEATGTVTSVSPTTPSVFSPEPIASQPASLTAIRGVPDIFGNEPTLSGQVFNPLLTSAEVFTPGASGRALRTPQAQRPPVPTPRPAYDPMRVANGNAPRSMTATTFGNVLGNGRIDIGTLVNDAEIRRMAGEGEMEGLERAGRNAASRVPPSMLRQLQLSPDQARRFQREGVSALTEPQKSSLRDALAERRMVELRNLARAGSTVDGSRAQQLFTWLDRFDIDGRSGSIALVEPNNPARLTPAGRVLQRLLERTSTSTSFTEREFIAGFRNGVIDAEKLRANPGLRSQLQQLGMLGLLDQIAANGSAQLTVAQARSLFRRIDAVDNNQSGDSFIARTGGLRGGNFPFNVAGQPEVVGTAAGRGVAALNGVFTSNYTYGPGEEPHPEFDVPPPAVTDTADPLVTPELTGRIASRTSIDRATYADIMRDARIQLSNITPADQAALAAAGVTMDMLRSVATPNSTIGGPNAEMARLFALLQTRQSAPADPLRLKVGNQLTPVGQVFDILERYTTLYTTVTGERLRQDYAGQRIDLSALDRTTPGGSTVRAQLQQLGFNADEFASWARGSSDRLNGETAAWRIFEMVRGAGGYAEARNGTIAIGSRVEGPNGATRSDTQAGRILALLQSSGVLQASDQSLRSYASADGLMRAPPGLAEISLPFTHHVMRGTRDCFLRAVETAESRGGRNISTETWVATFGDRNGRITASARDLRGLRSAIDRTLEAGLKLVVGVARHDGGNLNRDGITDHWVTIVGRHTDPQSGLLYYEYAESATRTMGRFYVDPQTNLLVAPANAPNVVGRGGYQVTGARLPTPPSGVAFRDHYVSISGGVAPRGPRAREVGGDGVRSRPSTRRASRPRRGGRRRSGRRQAQRSAPRTQAQHAQRSR